MRNSRNHSMQQDSIITNPKLLFSILDANRDLVDGICKNIGRINTWLLRYTEFDTNGPTEWHIKNGFDEVYYERKIIKAETKFRLDLYDLTWKYGRFMKYPKSFDAEKLIEEIQTMILIIQITDAVYGKQMA